MGPTRRDYDVDRLWWRIELGFLRKITRKNVCLELCRPKDSGALPDVGYSRREHWCRGRSTKLWFINQFLYRELRSLSRFKQFGRVLPLPPGDDRDERDEHGGQKPLDFLTGVAGTRCVILRLV